MPKIVLKGKNRLKMNGFTKISLLAAALFVFSCLSKKEQLTDLATALALQDELTGSEEAVVWLRNPSGALSSHWIKNDVTGVVVVANRPGGVLPIKGGLWAFPTEDTELDYDWLELKDLVTGETMAFPLDEEATSESNAQDEGDAGPQDGGLPTDEATEDTEPSGCDINAIQSLPVLLGAVGPYVFAQYNEKRYDCNDTLLLSEERYITVNVVTRETITVLNDDELDQLGETDEVRELEREGTVHYMGASPIYNGLMEPYLSHVFATKAMFVQDDGDRHAVVSSIEILGKEIPKTLLPFRAVPPLVLTFAAMVPIALPSGWWPVTGTPEGIRDQLQAFIRPPEQP